MLLILFILHFFIRYCEPRYSVRIMNTPILNNPLLNICKLNHNHAIVVIKKGEFLCTNGYEKDVFIVDFSPSESIDEIQIIVKLLLGKRVLGKLRVFYFPEIEYKKIREEWTKKTQEPYDYRVINDLDQNILDILSKWKPYFHLYNHNCKSLGKYLTTELGI